MILRRLFKILLIFLLVAGPLGYHYWRTGVIPNWIETEAIEFYVRQLRGHIPFEIEKIEVQKSWRQLLLGHINILSLTLRQGDWRFHLNGPVQIPRADFDTLFVFFGRKPDPQHVLRIDYFPEVIMEPLHSTSAAKRIRSIPTPTKIHLWVRANARLVELRELGVESEADHWQWPVHGIRLARAKLRSVWTKEGFRTEFSARDIEWSQNRDRAASFKNVKFDFQAPVRLKPIQLGPQIALSWSGDSAEVLWDGRDFFAKDGQLAGNASLRLRAPFPGGEFPWLSRAKVNLGSSPDAHLESSAEVSGPVAKVSWKTGPWNLTPAIRDLLASTASAGGIFDQLTPLREIRILSGRLASEGYANVELRPFRFLDWEGKAELSDLSFRWPAERMAVQGLQLRSPFSSRRGIHGEISIERIYYRHLQAILGRMPFAAEPQGRKFSIAIGKAGLALPLSIQGIPLRLDPLRGEANHRPDGWDYRLTTRLDLPTLGLERVTDPFCVPTRLPPVTTEAHFSAVQLTPGAIDLTGYAQAGLFGGSVVLDDAGIYDLSTGAPEVDFNLRMDGIRLDQFTRWFHYGKIDGVLAGHANNVVLQGALPTQYDFKFELIPIHGKKVGFSPTAMKNTVRLVAGDNSFEHLPGIMRWLYFGWPSRFWSTYDIDYSGLRMKADKGFITIETLNPLQSALSPKELSDDDCLNGKHYILCGRHFKIALNNLTYPVVMDESALANYVHGQLQPRLHQISSEQKSSAEEKTDETRTDQNLPACMPPEF